MSDEILVKGKDGKLYILGEDGLVVYEEGTGATPRFHEQPKGVEEETHEKLEKGAKVTEVAKVTKDLTKGVEAEGEEHLQPLKPLQPPVVSHEEHPLRVELEEAVDKVVREVEAKLLPAAQHKSLASDQVLRKRFRMIVSSRLRDVRDRAETLEMLMRPQKVGGMGLDISGGRTSGPPEERPRSVELIMEIIEKAFAEFQRKWKEVEEKRKEEWKKKKAERWASVEEKQKAEEEELEERYKRLTGVNPKSEFLISKEVQKPKTPKMVKAPQAAVTPAAPKVTPVPAAPRVSKVPQSKPFLPPPPPMAVPTSLPNLPHQGEGNRGEPSLASGEEGHRVSPSLAGGVRGGGKGGSRGKLTDVRKAPQLLGPMEELSALTLPDFRRLAKDPREGTAKILGKIEFLGKESLVRKNQAKEAWYKSPLYQEYLGIMRKAFAERKGPLAILESGQSTLTKDEWYAIMELNQKLRF